ncbi:hypothetical protein FB45DRAFT_449852 [Roridomyces roridus]|uniref:Uncharacterized protein n=1 Tax=Roridomyces roridus TaxID=1738132 RepID=A0AAD7FSJ0_9AGAR|nr:hypothetical protein FB45DRAFT_449852 [Roridomyces roridus]
MPHFQTRSSSQDGDCPEVAGMCSGDAFILTIVLLFVVGLSLLTLTLNFRACIFSRRQARAARTQRPPAYSALDMPATSVAHRSPVLSPPLDPFCAVPLTFDRSPKDGYFTAGSIRSSTFSLASDCTSHEVIVTPPPPVYVEDRRRDISISIDYLPVIFGPMLPGVVCVLLWWWLA